MTLYHGSVQGGITALEPRSLLHGDDERVVYLTDSPAYALLYLWDPARTGSPRKYVTGGIREGEAFYEEQFPHQLEAFYRGVSGWLYELDAPASLHALPGRPRLYYACNDVPVVRAVHVPDAYAALLEHEAAGHMRVLRYTEQSSARQQELTGMIAAYIRQSGFFADDPIQRAFMQRRFADAWAQAASPADHT